MLPCPLLKNQGSVYRGWRPRPFGGSCRLPPSAQGAGELHHGLADVLFHGDQRFLRTEPGTLGGDHVQEVRLAVDVQGAGELERFSVGVVFLVQVLHLGCIAAIGDQGVLHLGDGGNERFAVSFRSLFRCGFLGLLHMEIIQERLEREFDLDLVTTSPSVIYKVKLTDGGEMLLDNPSNMPNVAEIEYMEEPVVEAHIMTPSEYVGTIMELCQDKRGVFKDMTYIEEDRVNIKYELPLNEIIYDFFDQLKSRSRGYASFDYELKEYVKSDLVKLDFLLNGDICDALSTIVHRDKAYAKGRAVAEKLQEVIPRQQFEIPIQAAIGGKIIARETVRAVRKDVLAKCYGGDISRKKKLLEKQKEGKKRMRQIGTVSLPSDAFMSVLRIN